MKRLIAGILALVLGLPMGWALADFAGTAGSGLTFFSFTCFTSKLCTAQVPITSAGVEIVPATAAAQTTGNSTLSTISSVLSSILTAVQGAIPTQAPTVSIGGVGIIDSAGTNVMSVKAASTAPATTDKSAVVALNPNAGVPGFLSQYPFGATPVTISATGTTGATTATLPGTSGKTTYICWYSIRANATANTNVTNTITGTISGTLSSIMWVPANTAGLGVDEMIFNPCVPASAANTGIAVVSGAPGTGGLVSSKAGGYQL